MNHYDQFRMNREKIVGIMTEVAGVIESTGTQELRAKQLHDEAKHLLEDDFRLMVVGEFKRGKSTMINSLLGAPILPAKAAPCTAVITEVTYAEHPIAILHFKDEKKAPQTVDVKDIKKYVIIEGSDDDDDNKKVESPYKLMELKYPLGLCKNGVKIIDSPGLNEHDSRTEVSMGYLGKADAVVMVLSCKQLLSKSELQFIEGDLSANRNLNQNFFLLNHFDSIRDEPDDLADIKQLAETKFAKLAVPRERVYFVSALDALKGRKDNNLSLIKESGIGQFEQALELFLIKERGRVKLSKPLKVALSAIDHNKKSIPDSISALGKSVTELEDKLVALEPHLKGLKALRDDFLREIEDETESVKSRLDSSYRGFTTNAVRAVKSTIADMGQNQLKDCSEQINAALKSAMQAWQRNELDRIIGEYDQKMQRVCNRSSTQFLKDVESARKIVDLKVGNVNAEASPLGHLLASTGLQDFNLTLGTESTSFLSTVFQKMGALGTGGALLAALAAVLQGPILVAAGTALAALSAIFNRPNLDEIRGKIVDSVSEHLDGSVSEFNSIARFKIDSGVDALLESLKTSMSITIQEISDHLTHVIKLKKEKEMDAKAEIAKLSKNLKQLEVLESTLLDIQGSMA